MDFIRDQGVRAFGTRLRRLSERLDRDVQEIYRHSGVGFEPRWFPVVAALREGPASVGELAARIGVTHAAVSQVRGALAERGLVRARPDPADQRRQVLELTDKGLQTTQRLEPLWEAIAAATREMLQQAAPGLEAEMERLEAALSEQALKDRVLERLPAAEKEEVKG
jgi:DNA-binding MarR family transcriptional regulator